MTTGECDGAGHTEHYRITLYNIEDYPAQRPKSATSVLVAGMVAACTTRVCWNPARKERHNKMVKTQVLKEDL